MNNELLVWYSGHGLNNDPLLVIWIANKWKFAIQMFPLFRCSLLRSPLYHSIWKICKPTYFRHKSKSCNVQISDPTLFYSIYLTDHSLDISARRGNWFHASNFHWKFQHQEHLSGRNGFSESALVQKMLLHQTTKTCDQVPLKLLFLNDWAQCYQYSGGSNTKYLVSEPI